jgi:hypothetical protein
MNELQRIGIGIRNNILFTTGIIIGGTFEFLNHRTLMLSFMQVLYDELGIAADIASILGALFLVVSIVSTGLRHKYWVSWGLAAVTSVVSFAVYSHIWKDTDIETIKMAIVILSGVLPLMVAYFTHEVGRDIPKQIDNPVEQLRQKAQQARELQKVRDNYRDVIHELEAPTLPLTKQQQPPDEYADYADYVLKHLNGKVPGK